MMHYINLEKKRLCGRNNNQVPPILFDAATEEPLQIQFITSNNQLVHLNPEELSGLYFAGNTKASEPSYDLLFLSKDYTIENDILTFNYSTYTKNFLRKITKRNQEILIEIGQIALEKKTLLLRDYALANPRIFIEGSAPEDVDWSDFYTKEETQELLAQNLSSAQAYADGQDAATLASANSYTDEQISALDLSQYATDTELDAAKTELDGKINSKQDKITSENKLPYSLISDTPTIPTKTSELTNDSTFQTAQDVQNAISGKAETSYVDTELAKKQDKITADNKLDYALLSGTPAIPTKTSDLTNDSGFATSGYVDDGLALKQDIIDESNPISGDAVLITYDPWTGDPEFTAEAAINMTHAEALQAQADAAQANADIQIVSGAVDEKQNIIDENHPLDAAYVRMDLDPYSGGDPDFDVETAVNMVHAEALEAISGLSGKLDNPSGGTVGQVLTKTETGSEWADAQGGGDNGYVDYFRIFPHVSGAAYR